MLINSLFNCSNKDTYPPFKNGLYLEEYFFQKIQNEAPKIKRKYIPRITFVMFSFSFLCVNPSNFCNLDFNILK